MPDPSLPRIGIFGAGAIGSCLAALLAHGGLPVSLVARPAHAAAINRQGLQLVTPDATLLTRPRAATDAAQLAPQDLVIVTLKAQALPAAAHQIAQLAKPDAPILFVANGVPWWYFLTLHDTPASPLPRLDPQGLLWRHIAPEQVLGGVISAPSELLKPGVVHLGRECRLRLGEPDNSRSERLQTLLQQLQPALPDLAISRNIRQDIWQKLAINLPTSLLSTLTLTAPSQWQNNPALLAVQQQLVTETQAVAAALGIHLNSPGLVQRPPGTPLHYPSMLQDLLAGKALESDAQIAAVQDLARATDTPTPLLDLLFTLLQQRLTSPLKVN